MSATATFPPMSHPLPADPALLLPGSYLHSARLAVSRLAACRTLDDVVARFGSARGLAESIFGFPSNGGHATGPVVRTVGELLHHPLGPAIAAEALAMTVEVQHLVQASTIAAVLRQYVPLASASGVPGADETGEIVSMLADLPQNRRHAAALRRCAPVRGDDEMSVWLWQQTACLSPGQVELAYWHLYRERSRSACAARLAALRSPGPERVLEAVADSGAESVRTEVLVAMLTTLPVWGIEPTDRLVDRTVVERLVVHPERRVASALVPYLGPDEWPDEVADALADIVASERDPHLVVNALQSPYPLVVATALDELARLGTYLPSEWVHGDRVAIAALLSPSLGHFDHSWSVHRSGVAAVDHAREYIGPVGRSAGIVPFRLPMTLRRLDGRSLHPQREWTVRLLRNARELQANAEEMHNCTGSYAHAMARGSMFVVAIDGPDGEGCNASISFVGDVPAVVELKARWNEPAPEWMEASLGRLLAAVQSAPSQPRRRRRSARTGPRRPHRVRP